MQSIVIAKNTIYQTLARVVTSFIGFLITVIVARKFGVLGYGDFTKITSYVAIFYLVVDFGLNAFFLQYEKGKFKNIFYLRIILSILIVVGLNTIALLLPYNSGSSSGFSDAVKIGIFIYSLSVISQGIIFSASSVFQKSLNYFSYMVSMILGSIINLIFVFIFIY